MSKCMSRSFSPCFFTTKSSATMATSRCLWDVERSSRDRFTLLVSRLLLVRSLRSALQNKKERNLLRKNVISTRISHRCYFCKDGVVRLCCSCDSLLTKKVKLNLISHQLWDWVTETILKKLFSLWFKTIWGYILYFSSINFTERTPLKSFFYLILSNLVVQLI